MSSQPARYYGGFAFADQRAPARSERMHLPAPRPAQPRAASLPASVRRPSPPAGGDQRPKALTQPVRQLLRGPVLVAHEINDRIRRYVASAVVPVPAPVALSSRMGTEGVVRRFGV